MKIKGVQTIAEYKETQKKYIEKWIDKNFQTGAVTWTMHGTNAIKITDKSGATMVVPLSEIN